MGLQDLIGLDTKVMNPPTKKSHSLTLVMVGELTWGGSTRIEWKSDLQCSAIEQVGTRQDSQDPKKWSYIFHFQGVTKILCFFFSHSAKPQRR